MKNEEDSAKYFIFLLVMLIDFVSLVLISTGISGTLFVGESILILLLIIYGAKVIISLINRSPRAYISLTIFFGVMMVNFIFLNLLLGASVIYPVAIVTSMIGFLLAVFSVRRPARQLDVYDNIDDIAEERRLIAEQLKGLEDNHDKVVFENKAIVKQKKKFFGAKNSKVYHISGCDVLKKMKNPIELTQYKIRKGKIKAHTCIRKAIS